MTASRFKFSKTAIEKLPTPEPGKRSTFYDTEIPKLALRLTSAGNKSFYVVRRTRHRMDWIKLGSLPDLTVEMARREAAKVLGAFAGEEDPAEARRAAKGMPTLSEFFQDYGARHGSRKKSWKDDQQRFRDYLLRPLGGHKLDCIGRDMVGRILSAMDTSGKAAATVNNVRALASGIFGKAVEWSYLKDNPVKGIKTRKAVRRDRYLRKDELLRFYAALNAEQNIVIRDFLWLCLLTGARRSNVLAMKWADLSLVDGVWRIPVTKNGEPQNVTLSPEAIALLKSRRDVSQGLPWVFPGEGKTGHLVEPKNGWRRVFDRDELSQLMDRINALEGSGSMPSTEESLELSESLLTRALKAARAKAGDLGIRIDDARMPHVRIHDLRRTLGSWQAKSGTSLHVIGKSLNHKSYQSTLIYARLDLDPVRDSVNTATNNMGAREALGELLLSGLNK